MCDLFMRFKVALLQANSLLLQLSSLTEYHAAIMGFEVRAGVKSLIFQVKLLIASTILVGFYNTSKYKRTCHK